MNAIASLPSNAYVYGQVGEGINAMLAGVSDAVDTLCTEVVYTCHLQAYCNELVTLIVHGRGLIDVGTLRCRASVGAGSAGELVENGVAVAVDDETVRCEMGYVDAATADGNLAFSNVQVSIDGGTHWSRVNPQATSDLRGLHDPRGAESKAPPPAALEAMLVTATSDGFITRG